jgi:predicted nucleic acid-binding protein
VKLEMLHNARNPSEFFAMETQLDLITTLPIDVHASRAAVGALRDLAVAGAGPLHHRLGHGDALIAATAANAALDVLHYDAHFDRLSTVLGFESVWIANRGDF